MLSISVPQTVVIPSLGFTELILIFCTRTVQAGLCYVRLGQRRVHRYERIETGVILVSSFHGVQVSRMLGSDVDSAEMDEMMKDADVVCLLSSHSIYHCHRMEMANWTTVNLSRCS